MGPVNPGGSARQASGLLGRRAERELVPTTPGTSARWHTHDYPGPYCRWHYHPEYEIHLIRRGTGQYIVGDDIGSFAAGQLVLVGSNLPHHWISDLAQDETIADRDVVLQFHPDWLTECRRLLPELDSLAPLFVRAGRGVEFTGATAVAGGRELEAIGSAHGIDRLQHLMSLLATLNDAPAAEVTLLASRWLPPLGDDRAADLVDQVLKYVSGNLSGELRMSEAAAQAGLSPSAFSRYFKRISGQTFSDMVRKLRLARARQLLEHTDAPISQIYARVGYQNLSNFNRQFRREHGTTPSAYRAALARDGR